MSVKKVKESPRDNRSAKDSHSRLKGQPLRRCDSAFSSVPPKSRTTGEKIKWGNSAAMLDCCCRVPQQINWVFLRAEPDSGSGIWLQMLRKYELHCLHWYTFERL